MIHDSKNSTKKRLVDAAGNKIRMVSSFNDETNEAEIFLTTDEGRVVMAEVNPPSEGLVWERKPVMVKVIIPGARIVSTDDKEQL